MKDSLDGCKELTRLAETNYSPEMRAPGGPINQGILDQYIEVGHASDAGALPPRYELLESRAWTCAMSASLFPLDARLEHAIAAQSYRGLVNVKSPFDLALYARLIWELQPASIIELGTFHGGSSLWLHDQAKALCEKPCQVHSFDYYDGLRSPTLENSGIVFHKTDLMAQEPIAPSLLDSLPHPWLVIDDAHVDIIRVLRYIDPFVKVGDYYVIEDCLNSLNLHAIEEYVSITELGYVVDTYFTDAFGYNNTVSPNGWLMKTDPTTWDTVEGQNVGVGDWVPAE